MFNTVEDIKIDYLKANHVRLYYFGLGFIQLKLNEKSRLHFYTKELPAITEDIHNHRYDFTSKILKGIITNQLYRVVDGNTHIMVNESCNPEIEAVKMEFPCAVKPKSTTTYGAGESYSIKDWEFHTVKANNCITYLERTDYTKEFAQIVLPKDKQSICPFSKKIEEKVLWSIIEDMIN